MLTPDGLTETASQSLSRRRERDPSDPFFSFLYAKFANYIMERQLAHRGRALEILVVAGPSPALFLFLILILRKDERSWTK